MNLSTIIFSLFSSWLLAFPFEGQVLYMLSQRFNLNPQNMVFNAMLAHFVGLFICGYFIKTIKQAKKLMTFSISLCILGSLPFFFPPTVLWDLSLIIIAVFASASIAAWSYYFKNFTPTKERLKTAANVLMFSNALMILINVITVNLSPYAGLTIALVFLAISLYLHIKLAVSEESAYEERPKDFISSSKPLVFLCLFIVVITINSGLMYHVVNPEFEHLKGIASWYWSIPYIVAIYIMKNLPSKVNRNYILYLAITMMGFSFISFMTLDRSITSYFIINTVMLTACGIYDLFWWSILGEMIDYHQNPAKIFGIGLSSNVLGILLGCLIGDATLFSDTIVGVSIFALGILFLTLLIMPFLHKHLVLLLKSHVFLSTIYDMPPTKQKETITKLVDMDILTQRENEITELLLKGRTYKMIAQELFLSENTVKTHIKNIYSKFHVQSKTELLILFMNKK